MLPWPGEGECEVEFIDFSCSGTDRTTMEYASRVGCCQFSMLSHYIEYYGPAFISNLRSIVFLACRSDGLGGLSSVMRLAFALSGAELLGVLRFYSDRFLHAASVWRCHSECVGS